MPVDVELTTASIGVVPTVATLAQHGLDNERISPLVSRNVL